MSVYDMAVAKTIVMVSETKRRRRVVESNHNFPALLLDLKKNKTEGRAKARPTFMREAMPSNERKPLEQVQRLSTYLHIASRLSGAGEGTLLTPTDGSPFSSERCLHSGFVIESRRDWYGVALQSLEVDAS